MTWLALGTAYCGLAQLNHSVKPDDKDPHFDINDAAKFLSTIECIVLLYQTGMLLLRYDSQTIGSCHSTLPSEMDETSVPLMVNHNCNAPSRANNILKEYGTLSNAKYFYTYIELFDDMCENLSRSVQLKKRATHPFYRRADISLTHVHTDFVKVRKRLQYLFGRHNSILLLDSKFAIEACANHTDVTETCANLPPSSHNATHISTMPLVMTSPSHDSGDTLQPEVFKQRVPQLSDSNTTNVDMAYTDRTTPHFDVPITVQNAPTAAANQGHCSVGGTSIVNNALQPTSSLSAIDTVQKTAVPDSKIGNTYPSSTSSNNVDVPLNNDTTTSLMLETSIDLAESQVDLRPMQESPIDMPYENDAEEALFLDNDNSVSSPSGSLSPTASDSNPTVPDSEMGSINYGSTSTSSRNVAVPSSNHAATLLMLETSNDRADFQDDAGSMHELPSEKPYKSHVDEALFFDNDNSVSPPPGGSLSPTASDSNPTVPDSEMGITNYSRTSTSSRNGAVPSSNNAATLSMLGASNDRAVPTIPKSKTGKVKSLALPSDSTCLPPLDCFVRQHCVQAFAMMTSPDYRRRGGRQCHLIRLGYIVLIVLTPVRKSTVLNIQQKLML
jgi:hypothetical protein